MFRRLEIRPESSCLNQDSTGLPQSPGFRRPHSDFLLSCPPHGARFYGAKCMCHIDPTSSLLTIIWVPGTLELPISMTWDWFAWLCGWWIPHCYSAHEATYFSCSNSSPYNACFFGVSFLIYYFYFYYFHLKKISRFSWHVCSSQA